LESFTEKGHLDEICMGILGKTQFVHFVHLDNYDNKLGLSCAKLRETLLDKNILFSTLSPLTRPPFFLNL
jgi:hypothetical protein